MEGKKLVATIKSMVVSRGMSMAEFYKKSGITGGAMSQWKSGETQPALSSLQRIADVLGTTVSDLVETDEKTKTPATENGDGSNGTDDKSELMELYDSFDPSDRARLLAFAQGLRLSRNPHEEAPPKDA